MKWRMVMLSFALQCYLVVVTKMRSCLHSTQKILSPNMYRLNYAVAKRSQKTLGKSRTLKTFVPLLTQRVCGRADTQPPETLFSALKTR